MRCRGRSSAGAFVSWSTSCRKASCSQPQVLDPESRAGAGRALAEIRVTDDLSAYHLPGGAVAQVAIYTDHWHEFALLRKILLRMKSWENYIFLEGH